MARLPVVSGKEAITVFERVGWTVSRQEGSHVILTKAKTSTVLSVPKYRELRRGTVRSLIRDAGLSVEEFVSLLRGRRPG